MLISYREIFRRNLFGQKRFNFFKNSTHVGNASVSPKLNKNITQNVTWIKLSQFLVQFPGISSFIISFEKFSFRWLLPFASTNSSYLLVKIIIKDHNKKDFSLVWKIRTSHAHCLSYTTCLKIDEWHYRLLLLFEIIS